MPKVGSRTPTQIKRPPPQPTIFSRRNLIILGSVSVVALGLIAAYALSKRGEPPVCANTFPSSLRPYMQDCASLEGRVDYPASEPLPTLPKYVAHSVHAGMIATKSGRVHCSAKNFWVGPERCQEFAEVVTQEYQGTTDPVLSSALTGVVPNDRGYLIHMLPGSKYAVDLHIGMNPKMLTNQKAAIRYLEKTAGANFFQRSTPSNIVDTMKKSHQLLTEGVRNQHRQLTSEGVFRTKEVFVSENVGEEDVLALILRKGVDPTVFQAAARKLTSGLTLTEGEKSALTTVVHVPTTPKEIPNKILELAGELKEVGAKLETKAIKDPVGVAAWVHQRLGWIHPFEDGNGRFARLWMNWILQHGGVPGVIFQSDDTYVQAIQADQKQPGIFRTFLEQVITSTQSQTFKSEMQV